MYVNNFMHVNFIVGHGCDTQLDVDKTNLVIQFRPYQL